MSGSLESRLCALIERLLVDLRESLPPDVFAKLVLYRAASELLVEDWQQEAPGELRHATSHLALQALGVGDAAVERAKEQLITGRDPDTLNRRQ
jgi:hypothetical protein